jgi:hypothetical protein
LRPISRHRRRGYWPSIRIAGSRRVCRRIYGCSIVEGLQE